jgi:hypothetical protein
MARPNESLSIAEEGVIDPWVRAGSKTALQRRVLRLGKPPRRWKVPSYADSLRRNIKEVHMYYHSDGPQSGEIFYVFLLDQGGTVETTK